jgi:hypothetical protein
MEMQELRIFQGGALQAAEVSKVPGEGDLRKRSLMASQKVHLLCYAQAESLRHTTMYASFLSFRKPCIWSFLLCHRAEGNLRVHQA